MLTGSWKAFLCSAEWQAIICLSVSLFIPVSFVETPKVKAGQTGSYITAILLWHKVTCSPEFIVRFPLLYFISEVIFKPKISKHAVAAASAMRRFMDLLLIIVNERKWIFKCRFSLKSLPHIKSAKRFHYFNFSASKFISAHRIHWPERVWHVWFSIEYHIKSHKSWLRCLLACLCWGLQPSCWVSYPHGKPGRWDWLRHSVKRWGWSLIPSSWSQLLTHWQVYPESWGHQEPKLSEKIDQHEIADNNRAFFPPLIRQWKSWQEMKKKIK